MAFAAETVAALPIRIWQGSFDPAFFPTMRASLRGKSNFDLTFGLGGGILDTERGYPLNWAALSYTPQVAWRVRDAGDAPLGFRQDLVFKPEEWHLGVSHAVWPGDDETVHEIRVVLGVNLIEGLW